MTENRSVIHIITGLREGGAEASLYRMCIADKFCKHIVISLDTDGKYGGLLRDHQIETFSLDLQKNGIRGIFSLWKILRQKKPVAVQTWMYHADLLGGIAARFATIRNVSWGIRRSAVSGRSVPVKTRILIKICAVLSYIIPRNVICCAEKARAEHTAVGYKKRNMITIQNGYDLTLVTMDDFGRNALRSELKIGSDAIVFGMVARFNPIKDHANLLKSLSIAKSKGHDFVCLLVGVGMEATNADLLGMIESYDLQSNIMLLGSRNDVPNIMNALDVHILSSIEEGFPNVIAEAMACGTPCISTDAGDARILIGETGWVVPPRDSDQLAMALCASLQEISDKATWQMRRRDARTRIEENFSLDRMIKNYHRAWQINPAQNTISGI